LVVVDKTDGGDLMRGFSQFIAIVDFEATALSKAADVIEVGVAIYDRQDTIGTWSSLVRPSPDCLWSDKAAEVHKIVRSELEGAPEPARVCVELNRVMNGVPVAYCDGYQFDRIWMGNLFHDGKVEPAFAIEPIEEMPRMRMREVRHHMNAYLLRAMVQHRAGADALRLMQAYVYALGTEPNIVAL
jgi:DNA polymerase III epsilon subunit-like protein